MRFRTELKAVPSSFSISHGQQLLLAGSCFSENMGNKLAQYCFQALVNPFGTLFNPVSLFSNFARAAAGEPLADGAVIKSGDGFASLLHHSSFYNNDPGVLLQEIQAADQDVRETLGKTDVVIFTLGTAWVYRHRESGISAANCHRIPLSAFEKELLTVNEILSSFGNLHEKLVKTRPAVKIVVTVSPVRHIRDGLVENNLSKAVLLLAVHEICRQFSHCTYYPAYELLLDDLRDYRFYASDLIHPSESAVEYIWEHFSDTFFQGESREIIKKIEEIRQAENHRPRHTDSPAYHAFRQKLQMQKELLYADHNIRLG